MNDDTPYILAFDLGSTKIIGAVAQKTEEGLLIYNTETNQIV